MIPRLSLEEAARCRGPTVLLYHEVHCDDIVLSQRRDRATWEAARDLLARIVETAEGRDQRLALRFRHPFAEAAVAFEGADNPLRRWEERGHEIGTHAHRRHIRRTRDAVDAAGVRHNQCVVPGLIQARRGAAARTLAACRDLGFSMVTDQVQFGAFAYAGLTPWRPAPDLRGPGAGPFVFADVSVNPFTWGMLSRGPEGVAQVHGLRDAHFDRLLGLLDAHLAGPRPHPVCYFGYPVHEHQHARAADDLTPDEESLAAWDRFLGRALERPVSPALPREVVAAWLAIEGEPETWPPERRRRLAQALDRRDLRHDGPSWLRDRADPLGWLESRLRRRRDRARRPPRAPWLTGAPVETLDVDGDAVRVVRLGPVRARAAVVVSVSGTHGGLATGLAPMGLRPWDLGDDLAVWLWDRTPPHDPGAPHHARQAAAVFELARAEGLPTGWLTWSAGCLPALEALPAARPDFFVDVEAPADRWSLRRPHHLDPDRAEQAHNAALARQVPEPRRLLTDLPCTYHRVQADPDHVHGHSLLHARVMLDAAPQGATCNGRPWTGTLEVLPGSIRFHGAAVRRVLRRALP